MHEVYSWLFYKDHRCFEKMLTDCQTWFQGGSLALHWKFLLPLILTMKVFYVKKLLEEILSTNSWNWMK